jgi:hypothetical protein
MNLIQCLNPTHLIRTRSAGISRWMDTSSDAGSGVLRVQKSVTDFRAGWIHPAMPAVESYGDENPYQVFGPDGSIQRCRQWSLTVEKIHAKGMNPVH